MKYCKEGDDAKAIANSRPSRVIYAFCASCRERAYYSVSLPDHRPIAIRCVCCASQRSFSYFTLSAQSEVTGSTLRRLVRIIFYALLFLFRFNLVSEARVILVACFCRFGKIRHHPKFHPRALSILELGILLSGG